MLPRLAVSVLFVATLIPPLFAQPSGLDLTSLSLLDRVLASKPREVNPGLARSIYRYIFVNRFIHLQTDGAANEESCFEIITKTFTTLLAEAIQSGAHATYNQLWYIAQCLLGLPYCQDNFPIWSEALPAASSSSE